MKKEKEDIKVADLHYYATLPKYRRITKEDREGLKTISFDPNELWMLKTMNTHELRGLMVFCDIRVYEETPIIACTDDEMRMAYLSWRAANSLIKRIPFAVKLKKRANMVLDAFEGLTDWIEREVK